MTAFYLGLDVGGTKTLCVIGDETGRIVGFGKAGTGSYEYHGVEKAATENKNAVRAALADAGLSIKDLAAVGMGVAGADLPQDYEMLDEKIYAPLFGDVRRVFKNDSMAGLRGGSRRPFGIAIVCGTGSVCAGRNPGGEEGRVGGLGPAFGDACTGRTLAEEGLRAVWRARDGIIAPTLLTEKFVERAGCIDVNDLFERVYSGDLGLSNLEPASKLVFDAAVDGDQAACAILREGGRYLGAMVKALAGQLKMTSIDFELITIGSIFRHTCSVLRDAMEGAVQPACPRVRVKSPLFEPVIGALLLALEGVVELDDVFFDNMMRETDSAEAKYGIQLKVDSR